MKFWQSRNNPKYKLSQKDLIDISDEITQKYSPFDNHYQPELVLMPVDPIHLYAYWNLKEEETQGEISHIDKPLALRIYSLPELSENSENLQLSFDIKVYGFRNQQKVHLPVAATAYSAVVGELNADNSFYPLAASDTIYVPREKPVSDINQNGKNPILPIVDKQESHIVNPPMSPPFSLAPSHLQKINLDTFQTDPDFELSIDTNQMETQNHNAYILENYNGYGYDLKIYKNGFAPDFNQIMPKKTINSHISEIKPLSNGGKNNSGQGRLF